MYRDNRLKARLQAGHKCQGCWLWLGSADAAEILALAGFDVLMIDHEHGPGNFKTAIDVMRAAAVGGATLVMRVESDDPTYLKRALDAGVEGVMIPASKVRTGTGCGARLPLPAPRQPRRRLQRDQSIGLRHARGGLRQDRGR